MTLSSKSSVPDQRAIPQPFSGHLFPASGHSAITSRPVRDPIAWFRPRRPGELAAVIRSERKPLYRTDSLYSPADDTCAIRVDIGEVIPGDRFGDWTVIEIGSTLGRRHGWPCHCIWDMHTQHGPYSGCGYSNPECPCYYFTVRYTVTCRCICGKIKPVSTASLVTAQSLSCGHCWRRTYPCSCEAHHAS